MILVLKQGKSLRDPQLDPATYLITEESPPPVYEAYNHDVL